MKKPSSKKRPAPKSRLDLVLHSKIYFSNNPLADLFTAKDNAAGNLRQVSACKALGVNLEGSSPSKTTITDLAKFLDLPHASLHWAIYEMTYRNISRQMARGISYDFAKMVR